MKDFKISLLVFYLFVAMFVHFAAAYHIIHSILNPEMAYAKLVSIAEKEHPFWQLRYFIVNTFSLLFSLLLVFVGYKHFKTGMTANIWGFLYYVCFIIILIISCIIVFALSTDPIIT